MAHSCPKCWLTCRCGGDIDDCCFDDTEEQMRCCHCDDSDGEDEYEEFGEPMKSMENQLGWKEVAKDGKPTKSGQYHVYCAGTSLMFVTTYDPPRGADFDEFVTHWRELPEPPKLPPKPPQPPRELYVAEYPGKNLAEVWWREREAAEKAHEIYSGPYRLIHFREVIE